ncbi:ANTAR domain-containing protein [Streptomyces sp. HUAS TT7]|uniref:ANTAR domain-containing protein n=1 Tax=Streptomyces sp. HUAS TT7 TaxID=3447507 RepID=UPI003F65ECEE
MPVTDPALTSLLRTLDTHRGPGLPPLPLEDLSRSLGLDGLALLLAPGGGPGELIQCFGERTLALEDLQLTQGQGPGPDTARHGVAILVPDLASLDPARWPGLPAPVLELGVHAVFAFPLGIGIITAGVLTGHRTTPGPMTNVRLTTALVWADLLTQYLITQAAGPGGADRLLDTTQLRFAEVYQATGMLASQLGIDCAQALARLRGHTFRHNQPLLDTARQVLAHTLHLDADDAPER